jgi:hypothetical protein
MRTLVNEGVDDGPGGPDVLDDPAPPPASPLVARLALPAVIAVTALGIALRFFSTSALWLDEALSVNIASLGVGDMLDALRRDGHPPLYYLLLHYWMELVGDGDAAVRALSGIFGVATLPLAWVAGRRLAGTAGARWALVVTALSPYAIRYSSETRMYSLVMLMSLAGYLLLTDALRAPTAPRLGGIAVLSGLLLLTHYWAFYLVGTLGLLLVARWWRRPDERPTLTKVIVALAAGGVLFLPWLGGFLYQMGHTGTPWGSPYRPTELVQATLNDLQGGLFSEAFLAGTTVIILLLVGLFAARATPTSLALDLRTTPVVRRELIVVAGTLAVGCLVGYATSAAYQSRYAAVVVPLVLLGVAVGITRLVGPARLVAGGTWVALSIGGIGWLQIYERTQADEVAAAVAERAEPGDVVVFCPDQLGPAYSRAIDGDLVEVSYPDLTAPERVDWVDYADRNAAADPAATAEEVRALADGRGIFVVWMGEYQTLAGQCEELVNGLGQGEKVVTEDGKGFYEPANVHWFPAGSAAGGVAGA